MSNNNNPGLSDAQAALAQAAVQYLNDPALYPSESLMRFLLGGASASAAAQRYMGTATLGLQYAHLAAAATPRTPAALRELLVGGPFNYQRRGDPVTNLMFGPLCVRSTEHAASGVTVLLLRRELGIDLDLNDCVQRAHLCDCAETKRVCARCWTLVLTAAALFDAWITRQLGLGPMLVVASGGKGAHFLWATPAARRFGMEEREALAALLASGPAGAPGELTQAMVAAWDRAVRARQLLDDSPAGEKLWAWFVAQLALVPAPARPEAVEARWPALVQAASNDSTVTRAVLALTWPVIDSKVMTQPQHLLKAPFSIHNKTRRPALPLSPRQLAACDPAALPTVMEPARLAATLGESRATWDAWLRDCGYDHVANSV